MGFEWSTIVGPLVGGVIGFSGALFGEPLRKRIFRPRLELAFGDGPDFRSRTPEQGVGELPPEGGLPPVIRYQAEYIRVRVRNTTRPIAQKVRAYLTNVERDQAGSGFQPTVFCDSIPLAWSCQERNSSFDPVDLPHGVSQFVDVGSTREPQPVFRLAVKVTPFRYSDLLREPGRYRLTVQVSGENVKPEFIRIGLEVRAAWDDYSVWLAHADS